MIDQATKLREMMRTKLKEEKLENKNKKARVLAISSGKGGVAKTNFAINFSISLRRLGYDVVVLDADLGLSNIEIISGISLNNSISDIIFANKDIFEIMGNGPEGVKIISGGSGLKELKLLDDENFNKLISEIEKLQKSTDFIVIDTGAGISSSVINFIMTADEVIIICTPDPTSLMDSYTLIKSLVYTGYTGKINIVCNLVSNRDEGREIFEKLYNTVENFLRVQIKYFGYIERNRHIRNAVINQVPFIISNPKDPNAKRINIMAMNYMDAKYSPLEEERISFARRIMDIFIRRGD
ncbi:MAG: MinD/ParA family protein [Tissierellia bacterium]|nr:MinD/ParA family protein [Tissierellia bacterium]